MSFIRPVDDRITQGWGENPDYYAQFGQRGHTGIDYASPVGTPIKASSDGVVSFAGAGANHGGFTSVAGNAVLINHGSVYTGYAHLSRFNVTTGQTVRQGDIIGWTGNTGVTSGPHLHFEFWGKPTDYKNGWSGRVNPNEYLTAQGVNEVIEDNDSEYARWNLVHRNERGEGFSREFFSKYIAGMNIRTFIDNVINDPQAWYRQHAGDIGNMAIQENWADKLNSAPADQAAVDKAIKEAREALAAAEALKK